MLISYLPDGSYHQRHIFRGWLKAEVGRQLAHYSNAEIWIEERQKSYDHLRRRGYPAHAIRSSFKLESKTRAAEKKDPRPKKTLNGEFFGRIPRMLLVNTERTRMQPTAGAYEPLTWTVEDEQRWWYRPFADMLRGQEWNPIGACLAATNYLRSLHGHRGDHKV